MKINNPKIGDLRIVGDEIHEFGERKDDFSAPPCWMFKALTTDPGAKETWPELFGGKETAQ